MRYLSLMFVLIGAGPAAAGPLDVPGYDKAFTCSACHGFAGNSPGATVPVLAGQAPGYLAKALRDYASGKRPSTEMEPYARMAVQLGADEVAGYFASQKRAPTSAGLDGGSVARGKAAAAQCAVCHGADGRGDAARNIPDLRGQPQAYLLNQIMLFKADRRSPGEEALAPLKALMKTIPDPTAADLAAYFASQR